MEIKLGINEQKLALDLQKSLEEKTAGLFQGQLRELCREPYSYREGDKGGTFYQLYKEKMDDKFLSDEGQEFIDNYIKANWERIMKDQLHRALETAAHHIAKKAAFTSESFLKATEK